jgi:4-amino-4-deoxy-L-arabinose transferase-like glycosyltransferase
MDAPTDAPHAGLRRLLVPLGSLALAGLFFVVTLALAVRGTLGSPAVSVLAPAAFMVVVVCFWKSACAAGVVASDRPLLRRHGFWLLLLLTALALPRLGGFGLIDPWETHYAEVAREMLARGDLISTWWAHEGWFMSKPVLTFWLEAASMALLGVQSASGRLLEGAPDQLAHPEWAVRLPGALFMLVGSYVLYRGVAAHAGRHAGLLAGIVLGTAAQWTLASRHALTDTPFVGALTAAFGFVLLAWKAPDGAVVQRHRLDVGRRSVFFDASWLLMGAILCAVVPQLVLLLSRQVDLDLSTWPPRLRFVADNLTAGSTGNCGLPSQPACGAVPLAHARLGPALQALFWATLLALLVRSVAREERSRRLLFLGAWYCAALATMSKGVAGFVLPLGVTGTALVLQGRWRELLRSELVRGAALLALLVGPWYLAMYTRHGRVIIDELVLRHMLGRAIDHLHDTNAGEDVGFRYYVWQLGYAIFPWVGLVPAALLSACARRTDRPEPVQRLVNFALLWLSLTFALFTLMRTKFHHYILPAVPPLSVLIGLYLSERWQGRRPSQPHRAAFAHVLGWGGALLVALVSADLVIPVRAGLPGAARLLHLLSYQYTRAWPAELDFKGPLCAFGGACCLISLCFGNERWRKALLGAQIAASVAFAGWLGQHYLVKLGPYFGQRHVIEAYYRDRSRSAEPLIAYQLNWKGENFYTGNHLAIFISGGAALRNYVREQRRVGKVLHFVLERQRLSALRGELGPTRHFEVLTDRQTSDKVCLVRVQLE